MKVYIVIGEKENVHQDEIGGPFIEHPIKEVVCAFLKEEDATSFVAKSRLKKPKKKDGEIRVIIKAVILQWKLKWYMRTNMKAIAAMDENRGIGKDNDLPWRCKGKISEDFKWFKEFTMGKILVVGNKTFDTLPPLRNRNMVVLTSMSNSYEDTYDPIYNTGYCHRSYEDILFINESQKDLVCIGGAKTYSLFLPYITEFYVTHIRGVNVADTFMPPFEHLFSKKQLVREFDDNGTVIYHDSNSTELDHKTLKEFDGHTVIKYSR